MTAGVYTYVTVNEAAAFLRVRVEEVYRLIRADRLRAGKDQQNRWIIDRASLLAHARKRRTKVGAGAGAGATNGH